MVQHTRTPRYYLRAATYVVGGLPSPVPPPNTTQWRRVAILYKGRWAVVSPSSDRILRDTTVRIADVVVAPLINNKINDRQNDGSEKDADERW